MPPRKRARAAPAAAAESPKPAAKKQKVAKGAKDTTPKEITDVRTTGRKTEYLMVTASGHEEWTTTPPKELLEAYEAKMAERGVEKTHDAKLMRGHVLYHVQWKGAKKPVWVDEHVVPEDAVAAFWKSEKKVKKVLARRRAADGKSREYHVAFQQHAVRRFDNEWVGAGDVPKDLCAAIDEAEDQREEAEAVAERASKEWLKKKKTVVAEAADFFHTRCKTLVFAHAPERHTKELLGAAVVADDMDAVRDLVGQQKGGKFGFEAPTVGRRNVLDWCLVGRAAERRKVSGKGWEGGEGLRENLDMLEILLAALPSNKPGHFTHACSHALSKRALQFLLDHVATTLEAVRALAVASLQSGLVGQGHFLCQRVQELEREFLAQDATNRVTDLHLACLVATDAAALPELDAINTNASVLNHNITAVHLAALNPHPGVLKAVLDKGGDESLPDNSGLTAAHYAAMNRATTENIRVVFDALEQGVEGAEYRKGLVWEMLGVTMRRDTYGRLASANIPLFHAVKIGALENVKALLALADEKCEQEGKKPQAGKHDERVVNEAVGRGQHDALSLLLARPDMADVFPGNLAYAHEKMVVALERFDLPMFATIVGEAWGREDRGVKKGWVRKDDKVLLYAAIAAHSLPAVQWLVEKHGVGVNDPKDAGSSPLRSAVAAGSLQIAQFLCDKGAHTRERDEAGTSILMTACRHGELECLRDLVSRGVDPNATREEDNEAVQKQIDADAERNEGDGGDGEDEEDEDMGDGEKDPLLPFKGWVCVITGDFRIGQYGMFRQIERYGGKVNKQVSGKVTHCVCGQDGITEWGQRTGRGSKKYQECKRRQLPFLDEADIARMVARVPREKTDAEKVEGEVVGNVLHDMMQFHAGGSSLRDAFEFLAPLVRDLHALDEDDRTPLHCLCKFARESDRTVALLDALCSALAAKGCDPNLLDSEHASPLMHAAVQGKWRFVQRLLDFPSVDPNQVHETVSYKRLTNADGEEVGQEEVWTKGDTVLHRLVAAGQLGLVQKAVAVGGDVNSKSHSAWRDPLLVTAAKHAHHALAVFLLGVPGVEPNATDASGMSLLHHVYVRGSQLSPDRHPSTNHSAHWGSGQEDPWPVVRDVLLPANGGLDLFLGDGQGYTLPHLVCQFAGNRQLSFEAFFLDPERQARSMAVRTKRGASPLAVAVVARQMWCAWHLVRLGADVNDVVQGSGGENGPSMSLAQFCMRWVDGKDSLRQKLLQHPALDPATSLLDAIRADQAGIAKGLCEKKGLVLPQETLHLALQSPDQSLWRTVLATARAQGRLASVVQWKGKDGLTPLHALVVANRPSEWVLDLRRALEQDKGAASVEELMGSTNAQGQNVVHSAALGRRHGVLRQLLEPKGEANGKGEGEGADKARTESVVRAALNAQDKDGNTPLHLVLGSPLGSFAHDQSTVRLLLRHGAACDVANGDGHTAAFLGGLVGADGGKGYLDAMVEGVGEGEGKADAVRSEYAKGEAAASAAQPAKETPEELQRKLGELQKLRESLKEAYRKGLEAEMVRQREDPRGLVVPLCEGVAPERGLEVLVEGADVFDATLTLVNMQHGVFGHNQFCHLQVLKRPPPEVKELTVESARGKLARLKQRENQLGVVRAVKKPFVFVKRWGRIGVNDNEDGFAWERGWAGLTVKDHTSLDKAKQEFLDEFVEATGFAWGERYKDHKGSTKNYRFFQRRYDRKDDDAAAGRDHDEAQKARARRQRRLQKEDQDDLWEVGGDSSNADGDVAMGEGGGEGTMHVTVQRLLRKICNERVLREGAASFGLNLDMLPLGMASYANIQQAYETLSTILDLIKEEATAKQARGKAQKEGQRLAKNAAAKRARLTNHFYSLLPHGSGGSLLPKLDSPDQIGVKLGMLDALTNINDARALMADFDDAGQPANKKGAKAKGGKAKEGGGEEEGGDKAAVVGKEGGEEEEEEEAAERASLARVYDRLSCDIDPVAKSSPEWELVQSYMQAGSHGSNNHVRKLFRVRRVEDEARFVPHLATSRALGKDDQGPRPHHLLLWHGTRGFNLLGILASGLRVAPPEAPVTGYMFGKGVYFADTFQKSAGYCDGNNLMLLCEVALGDSLCLANSQFISELPDGKLSTKGMGSNQPSPNGMFVLRDGVGVPMGKAEQHKQRTLNYNEYIVYAPDQIRVRYIVQFGQAPSAEEWPGPHAVRL